MISNFITNCYRTLFHSIYGIALVFSVITFQADAQIELSCKLPYARHLVYQPVIATVDIRDLSAQPVILGGPDQNARLYFEIRDFSGHEVRQLKPSDFSDFVIGGRQRSSKQINLSAYYDMRHTGIYSIKAKLDWKNNVFTSDKIHMEVCNGAVAAKCVTEDQKGRWMMHSLVMLHRKNGAVAYMRVEDDTHCYAVTELGPFLSLYQPRMAVDNEAAVHTLFQASPTKYVRVVFAADGKWLSQEGMDGQSGFPDMEIRTDGIVHVDGLDDDYDDTTWKEDF